MWKRDEAVKPTGPASPATPATPAQQTQTSAPAQPEPRRHQMMERDVVNIGKSVVIKGELSGSEDLTIEGNKEENVSLNGCRGGGIFLYRCAGAAIGRSAGVDYKRGCVAMRNRKPARPCRAMSNRRAGSKAVCRFMEGKVKITPRSSVRPSP